MEYKYNVYSDIYHLILTGKKNIMRKILVLFCALISGIALLSSCAHQDLNGKWKVVSIDQIELGPDVFNEATLEINTAKSEYYGVTGVNYLNGKFVLDKDKIDFQDGPMTRMAADPHSMEVETAYVHALLEVESYSIEENKLILKNVLGDTVMVLEAM